MRHLNVGNSPCGMHDARSDFKVLEMKGENKMNFIQLIP